MLPVQFLLLIAANHLFNEIPNDHNVAKPETDQVPVFLIVQLISTKHGVDQPVEALWNNTPIGQNHVWYLGKSAASEANVGDLGESIAPIVDCKKGATTISIRGETLDVTKPAADVPRSVGRTAMLLRDDKRNPKCALICAWITWDLTGNEPTDERIAQPKLEKIVADARATGKVTDARAPNAE